MAHVRCMDAQDCPVVDLWDTSFRENEDDGGAEGDDVLLSEVNCVQSRRSARVLRFGYWGLYDSELFTVVFMELCMVLMILLVDQRSEMIHYGRIFIMITSMYL